MKWIFGLIIGAAFLSSCDNELVVTDNWKDIPIVWGLVSKSDTAHYIRVEKAFLDPTTPAATIAQIPDSLYYDDAVVSIKWIDEGEEFFLTRVNGTTEGYPRQSGEFASEPNYLYKIKANQIGLQAGDKYQFVLKRNDHTPEVTLTEPFIVLGPPVLRNPSAGSNLNFKQGSSFTYMWNEMPDAGIFDIQMRMNYQERSPETGNIYIPKSVQWDVVQGVQDNDYKMDGGEFYNSVAANIEEDPQASRLFSSIDILIWCGGKELQEYIKIALANDGITSTQDFPEYTNLTEGKGLITSRNLSDNKGFGLTNASLDSLKNGSITGDLNFQ